MEVRVGIGRHIVVDSQVDALDINTTTEHISGDADTLVEVLELLVALDTVNGLDVGSCTLGALVAYRSSWLTPE